MIPDGFALIRQIPVPADLDRSPELDALPDGSVVFDSDLDVMVKDQGVWRYWASEPGPDEEEAVVCLPALVIHEPGDGGSRSNEVS